MTTTPKQSGFLSVAMSIAEDIAVYPGDAVSRGALYDHLSEYAAAAEAMREALVKIGDLQGSQRSDAEVCRAANRIATSAVHAFDRLKEK